VGNSPTIVTGGAGFIGSNLVDELIASGRPCHVVDDLSNGKRANLNPEASFHELDIRDRDGLMAVVKEARPATIFHLAAQADVRKALEAPDFDAEVNVIGTINVLEAAHAVGARVVFASTGGAGYGEYEGLPVPSPETAETRPLSHYGMSKMAGEGYLGTYSRLYGLDTVILRLGNVYGPRQDPHGEAGVVAIFCGKLLDGDAPRVFGDGSQTRDYVYVGDVVRAFLAAENAPGGSLVNIGTGREVSVIDLIEALGYEGDPIFEPAREGELQRSSLAAGKAADVLGWTPDTDLPEGLRTTYESVRVGRENPGARVPGARDVQVAAGA
jgi:UDP-glucose 4-epimerase